MKKKEVKIIDVTIPDDAGKIEKYKMLKDEVSKMWNMKKVTTISPIVLGALGMLQ